MLHLEEKSFGGGLSLSSCNARKTALSNTPWHEASQGWKRR